MPDTTEKKQSTKRTLRDWLERALEEACWSCWVLDDRDAAPLVNRLIEQTIRALSRHPRMPRLSYDEWSLVLADLRRPFEEQLTDMIDNTVDIDEFMQAVIQEAHS
jgi:hypothetical protein